MIWLLSFAGFLIVILLMSLGVIIHNKRIQGSCGGLSSVGVNKVCNCKTGCEGKENGRVLYSISEPKP